MSETNPSSDAHAETDAHRASIRKACGTDCGPNGCGPGCTCVNRVDALEGSVKRIRFWLWVALFLALLVLSFIVGQSVQKRRGESTSNRGHSFDRRPMVHGPMQGGAMRDPSFRGRMGGRMNRDGGGEARAQRGWGNRSGSSSGRMPGQQPNPHGGDVPPVPAPPDQNAQQ